MKIYNSLTVPIMSIVIKPLVEPCEELESKPEDTEKKKYMELLKSKKPILIKRLMSYGFCYLFTTYRDHLIQYEEHSGDIIIKDLRTNDDIYNISLSYEKLNLYGYPNRLMFMRHEKHLYLVMFERVCWEAEIPSLFVGFIFVKLENNGLYTVYTIHSKEYNELVKLKRKYVDAYKNPYSHTVQIGSIGYNVSMHTIDNDSCKEYYIKIC